MTVLWCGGEDIDFIDAVTVNTNTAYFRSGSPGYARCSLLSAVSGPAKSVPFPGGAVSSGWISGRVSGAQVANRRHFGLANASQNRALVIGASTTTGKISLLKYDGAYTELAAETGASIPTGVAKEDLNVISLGSSGSVEVYVSGSLVLTYSGDLSWLNNPDCAAIIGVAANTVYISELIVADEDTRLLSLATGPVSGAGDSNAWNGTYADVDETILSDADVLYTDAISNDVLLALGDLPSGTFSVKAVREVARVAKSVSGTATQISIGIKSGGTINVDSAHSLATAFASIDRLMTINPVTGVKFTQSEIDALQFAMRSA